MSPFCRRESPEIAGPGAEAQPELPPLYSFSYHGQDYLVAISATEGVIGSFVTPLVNWDDANVIPSTPPTA